MKIKSIIVIVVLLTLSVGNFVSAEIGWGVFAKLYQAELNKINETTTVTTAVDTNNNLKSITAELNFTTGSASQTVDSSDGQLSMIVEPNSLLRPTNVEIKGVTIKTLPWNLKQLSSIYQIDLDDDSALNTAVGFKLRLHYQEVNNDYKQIFYYNTIQNTWQPLTNSHDLPEEQIVEVILNQPYTQVAIFSHPQVMTVVQASWYAYKNCDCAASPV